MLQAWHAVLHPSQLHNFSHSVSHELRAARNAQLRARARARRRGAHNPKYVGPSQSLLHTFSDQARSVVLEAARRVDAEGLRE